MFKVVFKLISFLETIPWLVQGSVSIDNGVIPSETADIVKSEGVALIVPLYNRVVDT